MREYLFWLVLILALLALGIFADQANAQCVGGRCTVTVQAEVAHPVAHAAASVAGAPVRLVGAVERRRPHLLGRLFGRR